MSGTGRCSNNTSFSIENYQIILENSNGKIKLPVQEFISISQMVNENLLNENSIKSGCEWKGQLRRAKAPALPA